MEEKIVYIDNIQYRGKAEKIKWKNIENALKQLIGKSVVIEESNDIINIGNDFPDEFTSSNYTFKLLGALKKAKANMSSAILDIIKYSTNRRFQDNKEIKHSIDAKFGWERYDVKYAIPISNEKGCIIKYNYYTATMIVRLDANGKKYLYDFINIKKGKCDPHG